MRRFAVSITLGFACLTGLAGCGFTPPAVAPLPAVAWDDLEDARRILIERQAAVQNVQAECKFRITPPGESTQSLDGAIVMEGDQRLRLRTWKLNQTIFDLTVNAEGVWIVASGEMKKRAPEAESDLANLASQLNKLLQGPDFSEARLLGGIRGDYGKPDPVDHESGFHNLFAEWGHTYSEIDASTLIPDYFAFRKEPPEDQIVVKPKYQQHGSILWYRAIQTTGPFGTIEITFRNVELNGELNPRAFKPPRRAVKVETQDTAEPGADTE